MTSTTRDPKVKESAETDSPTGEVELDPSELAQRPRRSVRWFAPEGVSLTSFRIPRPTRQRKKVRSTFYLPKDLFEEVRDAAVYFSGPPLRLTLASLAEISLRRELKRLKKLYNGGGDFPPRTGELKGGRPIGS
ncbi:MAG: hypothetical protein HY002_01525 [Candidatus Rokubacteria bacterium]|nr:hypothetical protein [Candidatus Rokubacteria bacterium]